MIKLFNENCIEVLGSQTFKDIVSGREVVIVTDPPFNIGYHYNSYHDNMDDEEYIEFLADVLGNYPFVVIHYPEEIYKISSQTGRFPDKIVSWVYNSNTAKQHRDIGFFGVKPNFNQVKQPYKNLNDRRIRERIENGMGGARLYDWWNVNQTKNVSADKTKHPCQMPLKVMENIIGILPRNENTIVVDPFLGSGTTGIACQKYNVDFIGCEIDSEYYEIAKERLDDYNAQIRMF